VKQVSGYFFGVIKSKSNLALLYKSMKQVSGKFFGDKIRKEFDCALQMSQASF
jgi:hypothetical protein